MEPGLPASDLVCEIVAIGILGRFSLQTLAYTGKTGNGNRGRSRVIRSSRDP